DYDVINVSGQVRGQNSLTTDSWGTLNVTHLGGFTPSAGSTFQILNYASRIGDFGSKTFPAGYNYSATANATNYVMSLSSITNTWNVLTGNWEAAGNWSLGHVPTATEDVVIPDVGAAGVSDIITVNNTGQVARSITNAEQLKIGSGDLTFTQT